MEVDDVGDFKWGLQRWHDLNSSRTIENGGN
jgi:hypothetical protein